MIFGPLPFYSQSNFIYKDMCVEQNSRYRGLCLNCKASDKDFYKENGKKQSPEECFNLCKSRVGCSFYSWRSVNNHCQLLEKIYEKLPVEDGLAGRTDCSEQGMKVNLLDPYQMVCAKMANNI